MTYDIRSYEIGKFQEISKMLSTDDEYPVGHPARKFYNCTRRFAKNEL